MNAALTPGMTGVDLMPDKDGALPPEGDSKFVAGIMWQRLNGHDQRIGGHDEDIKLIRGEIHSMGETVSRAVTGVVDKVQGMLAAQTAELKPLLIDKAARDLNSAEESKSLSNASNKVQIGTQLVITIIAVIGGLYGGFQWGKSQFHQTSSITVTSSPQGTTTVRGTSP